MSSKLAHLLGVDVSEFVMDIELLEFHHGGSVDVDMIGDVYEVAAKSMNHLGLDPANTTGIELYFALESRFAEDFKQLLKSAKFNATALKALMKKDDFPQFWRDGLWTAVIHDGEPVSFNVFDVWDNHNRKVPYKHRHYEHFRKALASELLNRYEQKVEKDSVLLAKLKDSLGKAVK